MGTPTRNRHHQNSLQWMTKYSPHPHRLKIFSTNVWYQLIQTSYNYFIKNITLYPPSYIVTHQVPLTPDVNSRGSTYIISLAATSYANTKTSPIIPLTYTFYKGSNILPRWWNFPSWWRNPKAKYPLANATNWIRYTWKLITVISPTFFF